MYATRTVSPALTPDLKLTPTLTHFLTLPLASLQPYMHPRHAPTYFTLNITESPSFSPSLFSPPYRLTLMFRITLTHFLTLVRTRKGPLSDAVEPISKGDRRQR